MRAALLLALLLASLPFTAHPAAAQGSRYSELLRTAESQLRSALPRGADSRRQVAEQVATSLGAVRETEVAGARVRPYLQPVLEHLRAEPPRLEAAVAQLAELNRLLQRTQPAAPDPAQRASLREVLADPAFAPDPPRNWFQRLMADLSRRLSDLLSRLRLGPGTSEGLSAVQYLLLGIAVLALVAVLLLLLRSLPRRSPPAEGSDPGAATPPLTSEGMRARAAELAQVGDYRAAVRATFVALLLYLSEHGKLRYNRSMTNREHLASIGEGSTLRQQLQPIVARFDDVWYGDARVTAGDYEDYVRRTEAVRVQAT
ncbi:MAG: DUF4129 domain-containing protein [Chloroflexota bacterium]|nr:DUF4129 domain-containing protein [Chloroflexota bacterium]